MCRLIPVNSMVHPVAHIVATAALSQCALAANFFVSMDQTMLSAHGVIKGYLFRVKVGIPISTLAEDVADE